MDIQSFRARLSSLDNLLRAENMVCGPDVWQSVLMLLGRLEQQNRLPDEAQQLAPLLGPLFCRHPEDQVRFKVIFEQWLADEARTLAVVNYIEVPQRSTITTARRQANTANRLWVAGIVSLIIVLVVLIAQYINEQPFIDPVDSPLYLILSKRIKQSLTKW